MRRSFGRGTPDEFCGCARLQAGGAHGGVGAVLGVGTHFLEGPQKAPGPKTLGLGEEGHS